MHDARSADTRRWELTKVAEQAGFQHAEYLSVAFKRRFGVPPSRYRQEHHP